MQTGYIKAINLPRFFGFIAQENPRADDLFFHASDLQGGLEFTEQLKFQRIEFELGRDRRNGKLRATAVWPASN